jgi:hypothetical protein
MTTKADAQARTVTMTARTVRPPGVVVVGRFTTAP